MLYSMPNGVSRNSGGDAFLQFFDVAGNALTAPVSIASDASGTQVNAKMAMLPDGGFVVAYQQMDAPGGRYDFNSHDVFVRTFDADGNPTGEEMLVHDGSDGVQSLIDLSVAEDGTVRIAYSDRAESTDVSGSATFVQTFAVEGSGEPAETTLPETPVRYVGTKGDDVATGSSLDDNLKGKKGDDVLSGLEGDDRLKGNNGNDDLSGGEGNDRLKGGKGDDTLDGGAGDDRLIGNQGADTFSFDATQDQGRDVIAKFDEFDTILIEGASAEDVSVTEARKGALIEYDGGTILVKGADVDEVTDALMF
ncbi:Poly(beta-D-mannuronate) C5 epimerase 4 [Jannaschia aquimarina]|uniref:AlgE4 protein n=2 Tax=Jannaschia aquimarina TaxID=935700 RepID=A0A0D1CPX8_9RHOB|nr:Poly(beta-D-mannuronate) C5 epimerase 4 [Jannaschia aquimarina]SNS52149.1 Hemolysin-type calcium-binding repeat-containing protein [Jannaschia aquimarina]